MCFAPIMGAYGDMKDNMNVSASKRANAQIAYDKGFSLKSPSAEFAKLLHPTDPNHKFNIRGTTPTQPSASNPSPTYIAGNQPSGSQPAVQNKRNLIRSGIASTIRAGGL